MNIVYTNRDNKKYRLVFISVAFFCLIGAILFWRNDGIQLRNKIYIEKSYIHNSGDELSIFSYKYGNSDKTLEFNSGQCNFSNAYHGDSIVPREQYNIIYGKLTKKSPAFVVITCGSGSHGGVGIVYMLYGDGDLKPVKVADGDDADSTLSNMITSGYSYTMENGIKTIRFSDFNNDGEKEISAVDSDSNDYTSPVYKFYKWDEHKQSLERL